MQRLSLRWGLLPRSDGASLSGRETLGRARCAHSGKGAATRNTTRARKETQGRSAGGKGGGGRERVLQQHSRASTWPRHSRTRASGKRSLSPCLEQQKHTIATRGVDYGGAACTAVCVAACNLKTARPSTAEGLVAWVHRNPTTSHSHPMVLCMTAKTTVACNVVEAQVVSAQRAAGVRLVGPFLHVVLIVGS